MKVQTVFKSQGGQLGMTTPLRVLHKINIPKGVINPFRTAVPFWGQTT